MAATGEQVVTVDGKDYVLVPTWRAIEIIEQRTSLGLRHVWRRIQDEGHFGILVLCLWAFNTNAGKRNKARDMAFFGDMVVEHGYNVFMIPVAKLIAGCVSRGAQNTDTEKGDGEETDEDKEEGDDGEDADSKSA